MKELYVSGDIGATQMRVAVFDAKGAPYPIIYDQTDPKDYPGSVQRFADLSYIAAGGRGEIVAASTAVAASINAEGVLTVSGALNGWLGRNLRRDMADALGIPPERSGAMNDVEAIAYSQLAINEENGRPVAGYAATLSSGFGGARYHREGVEGDEPGHEHLRDGASSNADTLVTDISNAMVDLIERHRAKDDFEAEEIRWTGGVALNQPFIIQRVLGRMRTLMDGQVPAFDTVTMGDQAGLHGTFMDALLKAAIY